jgi:hypothetical protein
MVAASFCLCKLAAETLRLAAALHASGQDHQCGRWAVWPRHRHAKVSKITPVITTVRPRRRAGNRSNLVSLVGW